MTATYQVHLFCDECGETHPFPTTISLDDGPANKASIGDTYRDRDLPPNITEMLSNPIYCPTPARRTFQPDNDQVFLVPIEG